MRLLDPIVHWPAKLSEADAEWCITALAWWWLGELVVLRELAMAWPLGCWKLVCPYYILGVWCSPRLCLVAEKQN